MYYFGIDEPGYDFSGKTLARCKELFEAMRQGGGKSVTAINLWGLGKLGDAIDLAILDNMDGASLYDNPGLQSRPQQMPGLLASAGEPFL